MSFGFGSSFARASAPAVLPTLLSASILPDGLTLRTVWSNATMAGTETLGMTWSGGTLTSGVITADQIDYVITPLVTAGGGGSGGTLSYDAGVGDLTSDIGGVASFSGFAVTNESEQSHATWNPADKASAISLSNGNLTAFSSGGWNGVRADIGHTDGRRYFEITADDAGGGGNPYVMAAIATAANDLTYAGDNGAPGWGISSHGYNASPSGISSNGHTFIDGQVIGISVLRDVSQTKFYLINGDGSIANSGNPIYTADISAAGAAALFPFGNALDGTFTLNAGATPFTVSAVPDSCLPWGWYGA